MNHLKTYKVFESETPHPFTRFHDLPPVIIGSLDYFFPLSDEYFSIDAYAANFEGEYNKNRWTIAIYSAWLAPYKVKGFFIEDVFEIFKDFESYCDANHLKYEYYISHRNIPNNIKKGPSGEILPSYVSSVDSILQQLKGVKLESLFIHLLQEK